MLKLLNIKNLWKSCIICIKRCNFQNNVLDIILLWFSLLISLPVTLLKKILVSDYDFLWKKNACMLQEYKNKIRS